MGKLHRCPVVSRPHSSMCGASTGRARSALRASGPASTFCIGALPSPVPGLLFGRRAPRQTYLTPWSAQLLRTVWLPLLFIRQPIWGDHLSLAQPSAGQRPVAGWSGRRSRSRGARPARKPFSVTTCPLPITGITWSQALAACGSSPRPLNVPSARPSPALPWALPVALIKVHIAASRSLTTTCTLPW